MPKISQRKLFIQKVLSSDTDECILWPFAIRKGTKYGHYSVMLNYKQYNFYAHNYICGLVYGKSPEDHETAHSCGNSLCVNPRHLRWATHCDNMKDAVRHGTMRGRSWMRERGLVGSMGHGRNSR